MKNDKLNDILNRFDSFFLILGFTLIFSLIFFPVEIMISKGNISISEYLKIFSLKLHIYSIATILAVVFIYLVTEKIKRLSKETKSVETDLVLLSVTLPAIIGARLWHLITDWTLYKDNPIEMLYIWNGGLGIFGAVIGVIIGISLVSKIKKYDILAILNVLAFSLPFAQIIGRFGNLVNQELFGKPTSLPWGMLIKSENRPLEYMNNSHFHPAYLYEQIGNLILFLLNLYLFRKYKLNHHLFIITWLIGYGIIRFVVEFFRLDDNNFFGLSDNQIFSLILVLLGFGLLGYNWMRSRELLSRKDK